ncbi:MAG: hypothetical protein EBZ22_06985 [Flavobacteriia bacterium]|nr:hypothetical protein [Flavobacteriia bacterium]NDD47912.1 hypothetical protein [Flavobacteriia bacterium]NDH90614.1 hypothetical protein [Flavobacteriia bacterium]
MAIFDPSACGCQCFHAVLLRYGYQSRNRQAFSRIAFAN